MADNSPLIVTMLIAAVGAEFGFIVWLFKFVINMLNERVKQLEGSTNNTLVTLAETIRPMPGAIAQLSTAMAQVLELMKSLELQSRYRPGDRGAT